MRKASYLFLFIGIITLASCKKVSEKVEELTTIRPVFSSTFSIPGAVPVGTPYVFTTPDVANPSSGQATLVRKATLEKATLSIENPAGQTFSFIKSLRFFLQVDGLPDVEVANQSTIDNNIGDTLNLNVTNAELRNYLKKDKYRLRTEIVTDEVVTKPVKIKADLVFKVEILI